MKDKDDLMNAVLREISEKSDKLEDAVNQQANLFWMQYSAYIHAGFSEDRAFTLTLVTANALANSVFGKK